MSKEFCVICGRATSYEKNDHIDNRLNYVQGCGQLCNACYNGFCSNEYVPLQFFENKKTKETMSVKEMLMWSVLGLLFILGVVMLSQLKLSNVNLIESQQDSIQKLNDSILRLNLKMDYYYDHSEIR